jgi:nucleoside-diphosphate-sugar epimerase
MLIQIATMAPTSPITHFVLGCGYLGRRVARDWQANGYSVGALTRSAQRAAELASEGIAPVVGDVLRPDLELPHGIQTVLYAVGYDPRAGCTRHALYAGGMANVLARLPDTVERLIYISSTSVFGSAQGEWVDEQTPCHPQQEGGQACLAAEQVLAGSPWAGRAVVLRLAGLYGPGRLPRAADLVAGRPIPADPDGWLNLIHVEDAAQIVVLAAAHPSPSPLYVVSDGQPVTRRAFYAELARLLGAPPPVFTAPGPSAERRSEGDKRVCPRRVQQELAPQLKYPSFREGLAALAAGL